MKTLIGVLAVLMVQGSTLFQVMKFYRTRKTAGVSIGFWITIDLGLIMYLIYAIAINDPIYILSNLIGITLTSWSIYLYFRFGGQI